MKKSPLLILTICVAFIFHSCGGTAENEKKGGNPDAGSTDQTAKSEGSGPFKIKSAKITYDYKFGAESGQDIFWFDDYGNVAVYEIDHKTQYGVAKSTITWKDKKGMVINHENKNAAKTGFRSKDTEPNTASLTSAEDLKRVGYQTLPNEDIASKSCMVLLNEKIGVKYWIWNNIELRVENNGISKVATSVEENITIPASLFEVPAGYKQ
jgi:hypothetical protein